MPLPSSKEGLSSGTPAQMRRLSAFFPAFKWPCVKNPVPVHLPQNGTKPQPNATQAPPPIHHHSPIPQKRSHRQATASCRFAWGTPSEPSPGRGLGMPKGACLFLMVPPHFAGFKGKPKESKDKHCWGVVKDDTPRCTVSQRLYLQTTPLLAVSVQMCT